MLPSVKKENPLGILMLLPVWYPDGGNTPEGEEFANPISSLGLYQIIKGPTNFETHEKHNHDRSTKSDS